MRKALIGLAAVVFASCAIPALAQDFQFQSAETIDKGNFKLGAYPLRMFGKNGGSDSTGVATRLGYGFTDRFDIEARLNFFDELKMYGGDAEYWIVKGRPVDVSVSAGFHKSDFDSGVDSKAFDIAGLLSSKIAPNLDLYGGVNASFESLDNVSDSDFRRVYLTPGLEYRVHRNLDLVVEVGLGLNDDSPHYLGAGVSFYVR